MFSLVITAQEVEEDLALLVLLVGYAAWWARDLKKGSRVRRPFLAVHILVYCLLAFWVWIVTAAALQIVGINIPFTDIPYYLFAMITVPAAWVGLRHGRKVVTVTPGPHGGWSYRGATTVVAVWFGLWLVRLGAETFLLNGYSVFYPNLASVPPGVSSNVFVPVVLFVAALYLVSFGVMIGLTLAIWGRFLNARESALDQAHRAPE